MSDAFLNRQSGTFTDSAREWVVSADQWSQTYYQFRDGKLLYVENDNKEQQHSEREVDIAAFLREHASSTTSPHREIVAFLGERFTVEDLLRAAPAPNEVVEAWIRRELAIAYGPKQLLELGYRAVNDLGAGDYELLSEWFEVARARTLGDLLARDPRRALAWCIAAAEQAWRWWKPALDAAPQHDLVAIAELLAVATNLASTHEDVARVRAAVGALRHRGPPPPYAGHFHGGLTELLQGRTAAAPHCTFHFAEALSFFCVAPDGKHHVDEVVGVRPDR